MLNLLLITSHTLDAMSGTEVRRLSALLVRCVYMGEVLVSYLGTWRQALEELKGDPHAVTDTSVRPV